ncbi:MAG: hypothetical protein KDA42_16905, partial [Planctomycetales bacterium]|nr:hypothetical protein [Planctomycetales bacterium]
MTIRIQCACGKVLGSHDTDAGLTGFCPYCGRKLRVPGSLPIQESSDDGPEVHSGPISSKSVKRVEGFMFRQQRRLWILALLAIPAMAYGLHWWKSKQAQMNPQPERPAKVETSDITAAAVALEKERRKLLAPPDDKPERKVRILGGNIEYDLSKPPTGDIWVYDFNAFGPRVGTHHYHKKDLDSVFLDVEVRWTVTFDHLAGMNL